MTTKTEGRPGFSRRVAVWDPLVRLLHWSLAFTLLGAWLTRHGNETLHAWLGYATLMIVAVRVVWGFTGPRYARFRQFLRHPDNVFRYLRLAVAGNAPRHVGHNPPGGWMILSLLAAVTFIDLSGWLYTTDRFWGVAWVGDLHLVLTNVLIALVVIHIAGVLWSSLQHRENLAASMIHGRKRPAGEREIDEI